MPAFRSRTRLPARLLLAATLAAGALSALPPVTFRASACPVQMPLPLRVLYGESTRVVVARALDSGPAPGETSPFMRRTVLDVSESLKGDPGEKRVEVTHWAAGEEDNEKFSRGQTLLLFLAPNEAESGYSVVDEHNGAKLLDEKVLAVYVKRIEELKYILAQPDSDNRELAEWLVRCAEDPATRWEGAFDLTIGKEISNAEPPAGGAERGEARAEAAGDAEASEGLGASAADEGGSGAASGETGGDEFELVPAGVSAPGDAGGPLRVRLTAEQKRRLADALFAAETVENGEILLVRLVEEWGDERLVPFALRYLRSVEDDPPFQAGEMMEALANVLKDDALAALAAEYVENATFVDYPAEEAAADAVAAEPASDGGEGADAEEESNGEETADAEGQTEEDATPQLLTTLYADNGTKLNATQRRSMMLRNFLTAVDTRLSERALLDLRP